MGILWISPFHCTPVVARDGTVYVSFSTGTGDAARGSLFAVRAPTSGQDGQMVWQADLGPGNVQNSPTLGPDGTLYIVNVRGVLSAIDSNSGRVKWTAQTGTSEPAQFGQTVKVAPALGEQDFGKICLELLAYLTPIIRRGCHLYQD